jgi:hypothetical protein
MFTPAFPLLFCVIPGFQFLLLLSLVVDIRFELDVGADHRLNIDAFCVRSFCTTFFDLV